FGVRRLPFRHDPFLVRFELLRRLRSRPWVGYAVAVGGVVLATGLRVGLGDVDAPFVTFYPALMLAALVGGPRPGLLAVVLSALGSVYLFLPPALDFVWTAAVLTTVLAYSVVAGAMVGGVALLSEVREQLG